MKEGQTSIFYMAADSRVAAESAPFVEQLVRRDYEVGHCSQRRSFHLEANPALRFTAYDACRKPIMSHGLGAHSNREFRGKSGACACRRLNLWSAVF